MTRGVGWVVDLLCVLALTALAAATVVLDVGGWVRALSIVPLVVLAPGWALFAALFPETDTTDSRAFDADRSGLTDPNSNKRGLDGIERVAFAAVSSIVIVALVGVAVHFAPIAITATPVLVGVVAVVVVLVIVAAIRRLLRPVEQRYAPNVLAPLSQVPFRRTQRRMGGGGAVTGFNVALAIAILLFATSVGYAAVNPPQDEGFTELAVDGGNVTGDTQSMYPATFSAGGTRPLALEMSNHEHEDVEYSVVVAIERLDEDRAVTERQNVTTRTVSLAAGETGSLTVDVTPEMQGDDLRIVVLAYTGSVPSEPTVENAHESLELPIDVVGA